MKLIHFSDKKLNTIDPKYHGSGVKGAESKRKINDAPDWQDRSYFYKHGTEPESLLAGKPYVHHAEVPDEKIYDFRNDPKKLSANTRYPNGALDATAYEKAIKEAGYLGYHNGGHLDNVVAIFYPVNVTHVEDKLNKAYISEAYGTIENPHVTVYKNMEKTEELKKAKKDEQKKVFGSYGSKKRLPKYLEVVENFARNKLNIEPVKITSPAELEKLHGKPIKEIPDEIKAQHNWKKAGSTGNYIAKPSFFEKDGKWHVTHLGTAKSLIHELAHIIRGDKSIPDLDQAMQRGFGAIKIAGLKAGKEAKAQGASEEELSQARKKSNQFAWPGEYETMGLEQMIARHLGLPANTTYAYVEGGKNPPKDVQVSMKTGEPIHKKIPTQSGQIKHITHLSENVPQKLKDKFNRFISGQITFNPHKGWEEVESIHSKINKKLSKSFAKFKEILRKKDSRCWDGYEPVPGKKPYSKGSCRVEKSEELEKAKKEKPFHGYNPKKHSKTGGLNDKERKRINREEGRNLKRPQPEGGARKKSFCARMSGVKGPTSKDGKLTPKGAALKRWKCSKSEDLAKKDDRCWDGYEPVPGKKPYSKGSCRVEKTEELGKNMVAGYPMGSQATGMPIAPQSSEQLLPKELRKTCCSKLAKMKEAMKGK